MSCLRIAILVSSLALAGCTEPSGPGVLMGEASNTLDGKPYIGAKIQAFGSVSKDTLTDSKGVYRFDGIPSGTYQVKATMGKKSRSGSIKVRTGQIQRLNFLF